MGMSERTTGNGRPWGANIGRAGSGVVYGYAAMKGAQAAQRAAAQPDPSRPLEPVVVGTKVGMLWVLHIGICFIQAWWIFNASVLIVTGFFDPMRNGHLTFGLALLASGLPAIVVSVRTIQASRALLARVEGLPPSQGDRFLSMRFFPHTWMALYLLPALAYTPFYMVNSAGLGGQ